MNAFAKIGLLMAAWLWLGGCATIRTEKAVLSEAPEGIRLYPPRTYLFVSGSKNQTNVVILPDYARAYDVKPLTVVAKQDFNVTMEESGIMKSVTSNQDTTSVVELFKAAAGMAQTAAKASGGLNQQVFEGTFGLQEGIYTLSDTGVPVRVSATTAGP